MNIDNIIAPVSYSQPNISMIPTADPRNQIERFPVLATQQGINQDFQIFFDKIVEGICGMNPCILYEISDKVFEESEFCEMFNKILRPELIKLAGKDKKYRSIDIELNVDRFQSPTRNTVGSFIVSGYLLTKDKNPLYKLTTKLEYKWTELFFTYKHNKFTLISKFCPFETTSEDDM